MSWNDLGTNNNEVNSAPESDEQETWFTLTGIIALNLPLLFFYPLKEPSNQQDTLRQLIRSFLYFQNECADSSRSLPFHRVN